MMNTQCPKCYSDKPLGATHCPQCTQKVTSGDVVKNEVMGIFWMIVIGAIIWNLIT